MDLALAPPLPALFSLHSLLSLFSPPSAENLLRYFGQVLIVIAAAEIGVRAIRPASARVRLVYWRLAIAACLLLPVLPVRSVVAPLAIGAAPVGVAALDIIALARLRPAGIVTQMALAAATTAFLWMMLALPWLMLAGAIARAAWLGLGFAHLRRLRAGGRAIGMAGDSGSGRAGDADFNRDARQQHAGRIGDRSSNLTTLALDVSMLTLKTRLAPHAELRWHPAVTQPIAFGLRRPLVLLPPRVADLPPEAQRAIVCHELLHVARRDWAWTLLDETIQTALWWHPAIWWALAQVHLQREEVIDARVVAITAARQPYMRALMLFAGATPAPAAAAAIPFIRRRHLAARLRQLTQEVRMSRSRLIAVTTALIAIIASASWAGVAALPLQAQQPQQQADQPIRLKGEPQKPKVITEVKPEYTSEAIAAHVEGEVVLDMTIAKDGTVSDVRVVKGVPELNKASMDAARKWKFEPVVIDGKTVEAIVTVTMRFRLA